MSKYKIVTAGSAAELTKKVNKVMMNRVWEPVGSHKVVETHRQNRYRGSDLIDTIITVEYSQTMKSIV
jgi:hypothetical protein